MILGQTLCIPFCQLGDIFIQFIEYFLVCYLFYHHQSPKVEAAVEQVNACFKQVSGPSCMCFLEKSDQLRDQVESLGKESEKQQKQTDMEMKSTTVGEYNLPRNLAGHVAGSCPFLH